VTDSRATEGALGGPTAAGLDGVVAVGSLEPFFGLRGLGVGWLVAEAAFVERAREVAHYLDDVSTAARANAMRAFHHASALADDQRELLSANAERLAAFVASREDVTGYVERGSTYAFLRVEGVGGDALTERAAERGLLVVPGRFFGDPARVRVSLGRPTEDAEAGLRAFAAAIDEAAAVRGSKS